MAQINYTATADLKSFSSWCTTNVDQNASTWDSGTGEGVLVLNSGVTEIGYEAFKRCTDISSITLPNSVTHIGYFTFSDCTSLTSVIFGNSLTEIGYYSFSGCTSLTSVTFPSSLTNIYGNAFSDCTNLLSVTCEATTPPSLGADVFSTSGDTLYVPAASVSAYQNDASWSTAFTTITAILYGKIYYKASRDLKNYNTWLTNNVDQNLSTWDSTTQEGLLVLKRTITEIGSRAFENSPIVEVSIYPLITSIQSWAFKNCSNLVSIEIGEDVSHFGESVFEDSINLASITVDSNNQYYNDGNGSNCIIDSNNSLIFGCQNTIIPNTVTEIAYTAFISQSNLTSINIPDSVERIRTYSFYNTGLTHLTLGSSVTTIDDSAFYYCRNLLSVTCLATTPPTLGIQNFSAVTGDTLYVPAASLSAYQSASWWSTYFSSIEAIPTVINYTATADLKAFSTWLQNNVDQNASTWDSTTQEGVLVLNSGVTEIGESAFENCTALLTILLPSDIVTINKKAFKECTNLSSINLSNITTFISSPNTQPAWPYAPFYHCISLTTIDLSSASRIDPSSFENCTGLTTVTLGNSLTALGRSIFYGCTGLTTVTFGNSLTTLGSGCFQSCTSLQSIILPTTLTNISDSAFQGCTSLTSINIPQNVNYISDNKTFTGCTSLTTITVDSNNTRYDSRDNCNAIIETSNNKIIAACNNTILPNTVTKIGNTAFQGCIGLTSIDLSSIIEIQNSNSIPVSNSGAFNGCTGLTTVTFGNSLTTIGKGAFYGCTGLTSVSLPSSLTNINNEAFRNCTNLLSVTCKATTPPTLGTDNFTASNDTLWVMGSSKSTYEANTTWRDAFTTIAGIYNLTTSVSGNGSVSPSSATVPEGESVTLTITPDTGYGIFSVTVDGVSVPVTHTGMTYTISNIAADHVIAVVFKPYFEINIQVTEGGSLSFPDMAFAGEDFTITATPNEGFDVSKFVVDGTDLGRSVYSYTFQAVDSSHSVEVVFSHIYNITIESTEGGTIEGPSIALGGDDVTFTITPNEGMIIFNVLDNDVPVLVNPLGMTYTISNIQENHTIEVIFAIEKSYGFDLSNLTDDDYIIQIYEEKKNL